MFSYLSYLGIHAPFFVLEDRSDLVSVPSIAPTWLGCSNPLAPISWLSGRFARPVGEGCPDPEELHLEWHEKLENWTLFSYRSKHPHASTYQAGRSNIHWGRGRQCLDVNRHTFLDMVMALLSGHDSVWKASLPSLVEGTI